MIKAVEKCWSAVGPAVTHRGSEGHRDASRHSHHWATKECVCASVPEIQKAQGTQSAARARE